MSQAKQQYIKYIFLHKEETSVIESSENSEFINLFVQVVL